jgi:antitoxin component YwqK of YwqJK toxin-antitoxin module
MKRGITIIALLFPLFSWFGCNKTAINYKDSKGLKQGKWVMYYNDTTIQSVVQFKNGFKTGEEILYFPDGTVNIERSWLADEFASVMHGPYKHYDNTGQLIQELHYFEGMPDDSIKQYYLDGTLEMEGLFDKGNKTGVWKYYDKSGELYKTIDYTETPTDWTDETQNGVIVYLTAGKPVYEVKWFKNQLIEDTIYIPEVYKMYVEQHIIQSTKTGF